MGAAKLLYAFLFLIPVLQFQEAVEDSAVFSSFAGNDVTLKCNNEPHHQAECNVTWLFSNSNQPATALFEHGQFKQGDRADRLSVTDEYSLTIQKVKAEDAGRYTCRKFKKAGGKCGNDRAHDLTVIPNTKARTTTTTTTTTTTKSTSTTTTTTPSQTTKTSTGTTAGTNPTEALINGPPTKPAWWWFAIPCVGLVALILTVVSVIRRKMTPGNRTQVDVDNADPEDGVAYATISYTKNANRKAQDKNDEGDMVTYSTVKSPSSSAADPRDLYASVNKPKQ